MWHKWHTRGASWLSPNRTKSRMGFWHMCDMFIHVRAHRPLSKPAVSVKWIPDGEIPTWKPKPDHILIEALGHETDLDLSPDHPTHMTIQSLPTYPEIQRVWEKQNNKKRVNLLKLSIMIFVQTSGISTWLPDSLPVELWHENGLWAKWRRILRFCITSQSPSAWRAACGRHLVTRSQLFRGDFSRGVFAPFAQE